MDEEENKDPPVQERKQKPVSGFDQKRYEPPQPRAVVKPAALQKMQDEGKKSPVQPRSYQNMGNKKLSQKQPS